MCNDDDIEAPHADARAPRPSSGPAQSLVWLRVVAIVYWVLLFVATHWPRLEVLVPLDSRNIWQLDKAAHVLGFGLLMALIAWARPLGRRVPWRVTVLAAVVLAGGYALFDEWSQQYAQRDVSISDLLASLIGVGAAAVLLLQPRRGPDRAGWTTICVRVFILLFLPTAMVIAVLPSGSRMFVGTMRDIFGTYARGTDKQGHLFLGIVATWLLAAAALGGVRRPRLGAAIVLAVMGLGGPVLETIQSRTGRSVELADMYMHNVGVAWALAGWILWLLVKPMVSKPFESRVIGAETAETGPAGHFVGHAVVVGGLTFISRITGLLRDAVLAAVFGLGAVTDAFFIGFLVPNLFRRLFGEGALSAAFIPHYTRLLERDPNIARRFASVCVAGLAVLLSVITILSEMILAGMLWGGEWTPETSLAIRLTMVMLPYMPLICLVALIGGILQVHHKFGAPAAVPVLLNFAMIGFAVAAAGYFTGADSRMHIAYAVAASVLVAGVIQLVWQVVALLRVTSLTAAWADTGPELRSMLRLMGPMVIGLAVFQINAFLDSLIAFGLAAKEGGPGTIELFGRVVDLPIEIGGVGALQWAQRLYQFPLGVFGIAIATAIFPALARAAADTDLAPYRRILRHGLRLTVFIGLPASVGLILVREPLTRVVFERGAFTAEDTMRVATILMGYSASVWAYSMTHVLTRAFYAKHDAKTPLKISMVMVVFNLALNLTLIWPLGVAGLAWSSAISAVGQVIFLLIFIRKHVDRPVDGSVLAGWARTAALTIVMGGAVWFYLGFTDEWAHNFWRQAAVLGGAVILGGIIVLGGAWLTRAEELKWLKRNR